MLDIIAVCVLKSKVIFLDQVEAIKYLLVQVISQCFFLQ